jgi:gluconolactonase
LQSWLDQFAVALNSLEQLHHQTMKPYLLITSTFLALAFTGCQSATPSYLKNHHGESFGSIRALDPKLHELIAPGTPIEKLASGFDWSEGPVWIKPGRAPVSSGPLALRQGGYLLFSDVPSNTVYRWSAAEGVSVFLKPSGYTGRFPRAGEPGSNGLTTDSQGRLVLCEHGDRRVGRLEQDWRHVALADRFMGKRFNSPNDVVFKSNGDLYFTDPPYGLVKNVDDPAKELPFQGVYRVKPNGEITLLTDQVTRPNGIAFSPDEKTLYVACSDPKVAVWMAYDVKADGTIENGRVFFDATSMVSPTNKGLPDGLKVDAQGNLWATGPGGVLIISAAGKHLGTIQTGEATANCAWGEDGSTLYITADMYLCRVRTKVKGAGW